MTSSLIAIFAVLLGTIAYLDKNDDRLRRILFLQALFLGTHYWIEGSHAAALITLVIAPFNLASSFREARSLYPAFALLIVITGSIGYQGIPDIFPIIAVCASLYALFNSHGIRMRSILMLCSTLWIIHDVFYGLQIILFMDIMFLLLNAFGIIRIIRDGDLNPPRPLLATR